VTVRPASIAQILVALEEHLAALKARIEAQGHLEIDTTNPLSNAAPHTVEGLEESAFLLTIAWSGRGPDSIGTAEPQAG
jgi:hypothetical protein